MSERRLFLLESHYLPSVQYLSKFVQQTDIYIEQYENYRKGSYRNRSYIATANGVQILSIPLKKGKNEQQNIRAVAISNQEKWQRQHWRSIQTAYNKSPYFEYYADILAPLYTKEYHYLFDFNLSCLNTILKILGISSNITFTSSYQTTTAASIDDLRNKIHPNKAKSLPDPNFKASKYGQVFEEKTGFIPNLSILDLLFCTGPQASLILESCWVDSQN